MARQSILIVGGHQLVSEFAQACRGTDLRILYELNRGQTRASIPAHCIRVTNVPQTASCVIELTSHDCEIKKRNFQQIDSAVACSVPLLRSSVL